METFWNKTILRFISVNNIANKICDKMNINCEKRFQSVMWNFVELALVNAHFSFEV